MKNTDLIPEWEKAVNKVDRQGNQWKASNFSRICSNHFLITDYTTSKNGSTILKKDAVPTQSLSMNTNDDQLSQLKGMDKKELEKCLKQDMEPVIPMEQEGPLRDVILDHNYAKPPPLSQVPLVEPVKAKKTPCQYLKEVKRRKLRALQQKLRWRESKAKNMKQLINTLKKKLFIKEEEAELLHNNFDGLNLSLFNNAMKNNKAPPGGRRYSITKEKKLKEKMVTEVSHHFAEIDISKQESHEQCLNETLFDNHNLWLVKCIADQFFKLRLFTYAKTYNERIVGKGLPSRRHQLNKLILLQNQ